MEAVSIPADALTPVGTYIGKCQLKFEKTSITIKGASSSEIGTWPYDVIRRFYCHDLIYFRFTSGRRGPHGVQDYKFRVNEHDLVALQKVLAQYTGAHFEPPPRSTRSNSESQVPVSGPLPTHQPPNRLTHSPSVSHVLPPPTQPGYQTMTITGETKIITPSVGPPPSTSFSRPPSVSSRLSSSSSPKNSPKLSNNKKFISSLSTDDPFFGPQRTHSSSSVSSLDFGPTPSPTTPTSRASKTSPRTSRVSPHTYEDAEKIPPKSSGSDRLRKEEINPSSSTLTFSYDSVEKRIKSPSPKDKSPPLSPPLTDREIKHIKKYNKEPLINKSETVHHRRNTEYNYIDIPQSETSSECGSIDSRPSSSLIYDVPTSRPQSNADLLESDRSSLYDVPPPPRPLFPDTYDVPRSSVVLPPSSTPISSRALPHLPNDYVNMRPQGNGFVMEDLYSVIPERGSLTATNATVSQSQPVDGAKERGELPGQKLAQEMAEEEGYILVNPATLPALVSPPPTSCQSLSRSDSKTPPLEIDNEYIEVRRQPAVRTAPVSSGLDVPVSPVPLNNPPLPVHHYINVPSRSPSQRKGTNPYEEITEVRPVLLMRSEGIGIETLTISPSPTVKEEASTEETNSTFTDSIPTDGVIDSSSVVGGVDVSPKVTSETRISTTPLSEPVESAPPPITARVSRCVVSDTNNDHRNTTQYHNVSITGSINSKLSSSTASTDESNDENKVLHLKTDPPSPPPPLNSSLSVPEEILSNPLEEDDGMECSSSHVETVTPEEEIKGYLTQDSVTSSLTDSLTPVQETSLSSNNLLPVGETHRSVSAPIPLSKSLVPVAQGSPDAFHISHRKRSLTSGDPLESPQYKEPSKKHTYVNVPAEFVPINPSPSSPRPPGTIKKPMPLPRPANISIITTGIGSCCYSDGKDTPSCLPLAVNSNCSNNNMHSSKVRALIRQFSS